MAHDLDEWTYTLWSVVVFFATWAACWHQLGTAGLFFGWLPAAAAAIVWPFALAAGLALGTLAVLAAIVLECAGR